MITLEAEGLAHRRRATAGIQAETAQGAQSRTGDYRELTANPSNTALRNTLACVELPARSDAVVMTLGLISFRRLTKI
jgi:hypothetical protein